MSVKTTTPLTIGLDIGIASVGWAVLAPDRIVNLGVRAFDKAETAKEGESLNLARRTARLMRRRLRRRAWRLTRLARLMKREGLIDSARLFREQAPFHQSVWGLRVAGLDRRLADEEWARVVYHLCKHRGFHWFNRAEEKQADADSKGEGGKVKQGLAATARLMSEKGYRTAAEMVLSEFPEAQRNKQGITARRCPESCSVRNSPCSSGGSAKWATLTPGKRWSGASWAMATRSPACSGCKSRRLPARTC
jgi:CRISPR-associated endonuclease Csn1